MEALWAREKACFVRESRRDQGHFALTA